MTDEFLPSADRAQLCQEFCKDIPTEQLSMTLAEYVCKQAFLQGMNVHESTLQLNITGLASQMLAHSFVGQFKGSNATNFLELSFEHPDVGRFTVTMQKVSGKTPGQLKSEAEDQASKLLQAQNLLAEALSATELVNDDGVVWLKVQTSEGVVTIPVNAGPTLLVTATQIQNMRSAAFQAALKAAGVE